jgi:hypothetical protein
VIGKLSGKFLKFAISIEMLNDDRGFIVSAQSRLTWRSGGPPLFPSDQPFLATKTFPENSEQAVLLLPPGPANPTESFSILQGVNQSSLLDMAEDCQSKSQEVELLDFEFSDQALIQDHNPYQYAWHHADSQDELLPAPHEWSEWIPPPRQRGDQEFPLFIESTPLHSNVPGLDENHSTPVETQPSVLSAASRKREKPLPPIIVEDPNDTIAMKRARNTLAARESRQRKMEQFEKLGEHIAKLEAERDRMKAILVNVAE